MNCLKKFEGDHTNVQGLIPGDFLSIENMFPDTPSAKGFELRANAVAEWENKYPISNNELPISKKKRNKKHKIRNEEEKKGKGGLRK